MEHFVTEAFSRNIEVGVLWWKLAIVKSTREDMLESGSFLSKGFAMK